MEARVSGARTTAGEIAREKILDAAFWHFSSGGLASVTIRNIAQRARRSPMGIYRHFSSRDAIVNALVDRGLDRLRMRMMVVRPGHGLTTVRGMLRVYMDFALAEPRMFDLIFLAHRVSDDPFLDEYKAGTSPSFEVLRSAVEQAIDSGELANGNSVDVSVTLWAQAHGLIALYVAGRFGAGEELFRKFFMRSLNMVIRGLKGTAA